MEQIKEKIHATERRIGNWALQDRTSGVEQMSGKIIVVAEDTSSRGHPGLARFLKPFEGYLARHDKTVQFVKNCVFVIG